jgi:hypothetical protein
MTITRSVQIGAAILAFILAVVWMLPPTTPVAPSANPTRPGAARSVGTVAPPAPVAAYGFDSAATAAMLPPPPPLPPLPLLSDPALGVSQSVAHRAEPAAATDDYAGGDEESDPYFRAGYRWAERNDIWDADECRAWRGTPREDGCLAYVEEAPDARAPGPDDDVPEPEPRSPY